MKGAALPGSFLQNQFLVTGMNVGDYHPAWWRDPAYAGLRKLRRSAAR